MYLNLQISNTICCSYYFRISIYFIHNRYRVCIHDFLTTFNFWHFQFEIARKLLDWPYTKFPNNYLAQYLKLMKRYGWNMRGQLYFPPQLSLKHFPKEEQIMKLAFPWLTDWLLPLCSCFYHFLFVGILPQSEIAPTLTIFERTIHSLVSQEYILSTN